LRIGRRKELESRRLVFRTNAYPAGDCGHESETMLHEATRLTKDLTLLAEADDIGPAYGRETEILTVLEVLARQRAKNVILIGEEGVGKTRILEGLAVAGVRQQTRGLLEDYRVIALDSTVAFARNSGLLGNLRGLLSFLRRDRGTILAVDGIDEILDYLDDPEPERQTIASTLLTPILRGEIACISTMTPDQLNRLGTTHEIVYKNFEHVHVQPMTPEKTFEILQILRPEMEEYHHLEIDEDAAREAIVASETYFPDMALPGKAVSLLDRACSRHRFKTVAGRVSPQSLDDTLAPEDESRLTAADVARLAKRQSSGHTRIFMLPDTWDVIEKTLLRSMPTHKTAVRNSVQALKSRAVDLERLRRPKAILMFVGPAHAGQEYLARGLAATVYDSDRAFFRVALDASTHDQFVDELAVRTTKVRPDHDQSGPFGLIFVDGFEHATDDTCQVLAEAAKTGAARNAQGKQLDVSATVFVLNVNTRGEVPTSSGENSMEQLLPHPLAQRFQPLLGDILDAAIPFKSPRTEDFETLIRAQVKRLRREFRDRKLGVALEPGVYEHLIARANKYGPNVDRLLRASRAMIEEPIRTLVSSRVFPPGTIFVLKMDRDRLVVRKEYRP